MKLSLCNVISLPLLTSQQCILICNLKSFSFTYAKSNRTYLQHKRLQFMKCLWAYSCTFPADE